MFNKKITIAIQSKGRLYEESKKLLSNSGISFRIIENRLLTRASNVNVDILQVRDDDIPSLVSNKVADLGIVGKNLLDEQLAGDKSLSVKEIINLGFSKCKLCFAKPKDSTTESLNNKIIASSYPNLVNQYLKQNKIKADVIKINGSVELTPYIGIADYICDLVSSGATLEANNLEATETLMESEAVLISSNDVDDTNFFDLVNRFKGVINAKDSKYVMLNCDESNIKKICSLLPGSESPTIIPLEQKKKFAIHALCKEPVFWETMEELKENGASSVLVLPVEKILN
ncbi:MAG: ATP phosphoribosyltransferase [Gammaproteobacteria bacterium]|jgi:ATP phosphoribosyltransferase|nr:ATP phosphoribosyltransferase [Gammaproteobacteria bacterium]URQ70219.1 ATP phosphoribosyltransferase [SAR86 cluster bacterium]URQ70229.1 ATP phosphoribosyltransferase [SAR86 cluster bacterium]|tara:strand:+ start:4231 stop:5091 length:861 start_codon:yes stop_codon:yes gene_type:complete